MKLEDVRIKWTSGAGCPEGISLEYIYHVVKKGGKLYFSDGNLEMEIEEIALINIITPIDDISWEDVEFTETKVKK
jgi:pyruvate kinase